MATVTKTLTLTPTKYGAKNSYVSSYDAFLAGTSYLSFNNTSGYGAIVFYSFDFSRLSSLGNFSIKDISIKISGKRISSSSSLSIKLVKNFKTSGNSVGTYSDLGDGQLDADLGSDFVENTFSDLPNTLSHINENLSELMENPDSTIFGVRLYGRNCRVNLLQLVLTYEYDDKTSKIHGCTATKSGYAQSIYRGTSEVKAVYRGTTKIYG